MEGFKTNPVQALLARPISHTVTQTTQAHDALSIYNEDQYITATRGTMRCTSRSDSGQEGPKLYRMRCSFIYIKVRHVISAPSDHERAAIHDIIDLKVEDG